MPGTFIFQPIEANLIHNTDFIGRMNPYCTFNLGGARLKGQVCKKGGKHPHWDDVIAVSTSSNLESNVLVELMDRDRITHDDNIGSFLLDLSKIQDRGRVKEWYPLYYKNRHAGEILIDSIYQSNDGLFSQFTQDLQEERLMTEPTLPDEEIYDTNTYIESLQRRDGAVEHLHINE